MKDQHQLSLASKLNAAGLVLFALGIIMQVAAGVSDYPPIPLGIIVCMAVAGFVVFGYRSRWSAGVGLLLPLILFVGTLASGWLSRLVDPTSIGYPGIVVQMLGLALALTAGIVAAVKAYGHRAL